MAPSRSAPPAWPREGTRCAVRTMCLEPELFEAAAMLAVEKDLMDMLVRELKEELTARDEPVSGNKAWLRRRLHAAIVHCSPTGGGGRGIFNFSVL